MQVIVDANILLASFLKGAITRELLLDSRLTLFAPEHLLIETSRHLQNNSLVRKRIGLSNQKLQELFLIVTQRIEVVSAKSYKAFFKEALQIAPHKEDAPYLALALFLDISIWSNDKGLIGQRAVKVYSTQELLFLLGKMSQ